MTRTPLALAALASAAVPGLDPVSAQEVVGGDDRFDVAHVTDAQERRWEVRCPRNEGIAAQMEQAAAYMALLARRVPFQIPVVRGWTVLPEGGRLSVTHHLAGERLDLSALPPGPGITAELGRTIALLHNADLALAEEAGLPSYGAEEYRRRWLTQLDRGAATAKVPAGLLARWEAALEDTSLWQFRSVPVHGGLRGDTVVATFTDHDDAATGTVRALTGWEDARVADPADDLAAIVLAADEEAVHTCFEAYAHTRVERPDANLLVRARLVGELGLLRELLAAGAARDTERLQAAVDALEHLDGELEHLAPLTAVAVRKRTPRPLPAPDSEAEAGVGEQAESEGVTASSEDTDDDDGSAPGAGAGSHDPADVDSESAGSTDEATDAHDAAVETEFDEEHVPAPVPVERGHVVPPSAPQRPQVVFDDEDEDDITAPHPVRPRD